MTHKISGLTFTTTAMPASSAAVYINGQLISAITTPVKTASCSAVWKMFDVGIARSSTSKNKGTNTKQAPTTHPTRYKLLESLDKDKDGLAVSVD